MFDQAIHRWLRVPYTLHVHTDQRAKQSRATVLFLHGIGNSGAAWDEVVSKLPNNINIISIDLLGFGKSPRPSWVIYNAKTQARSVVATLLKLRITGPVILVGHSLGALVSVEVAKRYPLFVNRLILFSPPFYRISKETRRLTPTADKMRREIYQLVKQRPDQFIRITSLALKLGLLNRAFTLTEADAPIYFNAFEASILNQTSLEDASRLYVPTAIAYGRFDPVVSGRTLRYLAKRNALVRLIPVLASHEIVGPFIDVAVKTIVDAVESTGN
ncbi:MAG TPA: alpha/beta fold hydrolase [Candidatus Saccharimonadales bacterium]|nr:alpha/beta fold hydrolase [Candidatus Saccharimonadales bacterium]